MDDSGTESDELLWCGDDEFVATCGEDIATSQSSVPPHEDPQALAVKQEPAEDLDGITAPVAKYYRLLLFR
ncbi:hypothetical protein BN14_04362 [Rhizoctonia solani AG-1 IB]|uniref:Uncharacterized protein n=1 Tax=Thanatephorus cucumeris (strain AG1-IB / isolate 7/3/14) TaxID=1108050 RepID=M5BUY9_THACB|nr:hypothetical protein BN14_04362 [Rhizoctonia solani AG-1 IB]